jgi:hypothetical protein
MPYIEKKRRGNLASFIATNAGELNYRITMFIKGYIKQKGESYQTYNDIMGALEGAKLELYRRCISKYEDTKITNNGDVY